ncbi:hypothetical protein PR202_ga27425 [Eleusine coracana subsp. coracana]|uniref:Protein DA1-like domain-containing protein n=1 Tax=Eleusine coracana subsp. coracana TaxID=191504 RepID=A0AAV5DEK0_ELECO|nr:hypothetical protein PR202_ga27425 [Eleusine coracana subsp. coracana]
MLSLLLIVLNTIFLLRMFQQIGFLQWSHLNISSHQVDPGLNMKVEQQVPLLLVERQALNEAMVAEKNVGNMKWLFGLILRRPSIGPGNRIIDMITGQYKLTRLCEVTAILILYGLPRLQTGSILAHEMMHAYLRLKVQHHHHRRISTPTSSKKGARTEFEKKLCAFIKHQIETDPSEAYGDGFRAGNQAVDRYGLRRTLDHMKMTGSFPY